MRGNDAGCLRPRQGVGPGGSDIGVAAQHRQQALADGVMALRAGDLLVGEVGDVEHVDGLLAERGDVRRGDVEVEVGERIGELEQQARAVEARHLDHGELVGQRVVDERLGRHREGAEPAPSLAPLGHQRAEPDLAFQQFLDGLGDAPGSPQLVLVEVELAGEQEGVEREAVAGRGDVRARDVGP